MAIAKLVLKVNARSHTVSVESRTPLLYVPLTRARVKAALDQA